MTYVESIWSKSLAASANFCVASQQAALFCSDAATQSVEVAVKTPLTFFETLLRAIEAPSDSAAPKKDVVVEFVPTPKPAPAPVAIEDPAPVEDVADAVTEAAVETVEAAVEPEAPQPVEPAAKFQTLSAPRKGVADDLTKVKGIGAKLAANLNDIGVYHFDQIATLDAAGIDEIEGKLPGFKLSCSRYDVIGSAAALV